MILRFGFLCVLIVTAGAAFAHHSAPVSYKVDERITVSGTVTECFSGLVCIAVTAAAAYGLG